MFEKLDRSSGSVVGVRISGTVSAADYERLIPELEHVIDEHGEVSLLCQFDGMTGIEPEAVWEDLKFDVSHLRDIARCSIVKDQRWQDWLARLSGPVAGIDVRVFEADEAEDAWGWIRREAVAPEEMAGAGRGPEDRARAHRDRLQALIDQLRQDVDRADDPRAEALFETAAETLGGLVTAFEHYEKHAEEAWREE